MSSLAQIEKVMLLRDAELFGYCNAEEVIRIASIAGERRFAEGETIFGVDDAAEALYFVVEGRVELEGKNGDCRSVQPAETFGVKEILSGRLRGSTAVAKEPTVTLAIGADDFFDLLSNNIEIVKALFREILSDGEASNGGDR